MLANPQNQHRKIAKPDNPDNPDNNEVNMATVQQMVDVAELGAKSRDQLLDMAGSVGLSDGAGLANLRREELLSRILQTASAQQALIA